MPGRHARGIVILATFVACAGCLAGDDATRPTPRFTIEPCPWDASRQYGEPGLPFYFQMLSAVEVARWADRTGERCIPYEHASSNLSLTLAAMDRIGIFAVNGADRTWPNLSIRLEVPAELRLIRSDLPYTGEMPVGVTKWEAIVVASGTGDAVVRAHVDFVHHPPLALVYRIS